MKKIVDPFSTHIRSPDDPVAVPAEVAGANGRARTASSGDGAPPTPVGNREARSEQPRTLGGAILRHPFLVLVPAILAVGAAIALGITRTPAYTAETRFTVGRLDVTSQAIPGVVAANQSLAATYSRFVSAEGVVDPVAEQLGVPSRTVSRSLRASPIPESPIIRIEAEAGTVDQAVQMANIAGNVLTSYVRTINQDGVARGLLNRFRAAAGVVAEAELARDVAQRQTNIASQPATRLALANATAELEVARIRFATLRDQVNQDAQSRATSNSITRLNQASGAVSDHDAVMQRLIVVGALGGLALGVLLALARDRRRREPIST